MEKLIKSHVLDILACPSCGGALDSAENYLACIGCKIRYYYTKSGTIDLRLKQEKKYQINYNLGTPFIPESDFNFGILAKKANPSVNFSKCKTPYHLTREIMSYFPKAKTNNSLMLDLGCGKMDHKNICELAGFEYVGLDYNSSGSLIRGDAHALPFTDSSFEFILSIAVLEHIRFPLVAIKEAYRVLKPNGYFIGTVAFLEPFHGNSFYHHTHLGTYNSLKTGGFKIDSISPSNKWTVLIAQASMGLFPKMPRLFAVALVIPIQIFHKIWWRIGSFAKKKATEELRLRLTTGAFTFIARK